MSLANRLNEHFKEKGININFDPESSTYRTWFGRTIPIIFDNERNFPYYDSDKKYIHLVSGRPIKRLANDALHEIGHANTSSGIVPSKDWKMIPALYISYQYHYLLVQQSTNFQSNFQEADNLEKFLTIFAISLVSIPFSIMVRYGISEILAEGYVAIKKFSGLVKNYIPNSNAT